MISITLNILILNSLSIKMITDTQKSKIVRVHLFSKGKEYLKQSDFFFLKYFKVHSVIWRDTHKQVFKIKFAN